MVTLATGDIVAVTIALTTAMIVIISTAVANHRLTEKVRRLRQQLYNDGLAWQQEVDELQLELDRVQR